MDDLYQLEGKAKEVYQKNYKEKIKKSQRPKERQDERYEKERYVS